MTARGTVGVNGIDISYLQAGSGSPIVMLHGIGGNAMQFQHQIDGLSDTWRVISWDAPGYGESGNPGDDWQMENYATALAGMLDALDLSQVYLLGQSWGGVLAQTFTGMYPQRVRALILSDTSMGGRSQPETDRLASLNARLTALETMTPAELAAARAPALLGPNHSADVLQEVEAVMAQIHPDGYRRAAIALAEADARPYHSAIEVPALILAGKHDRIVPPSTAEALHSAISGAQLTIFSDNGHMSGQEDPTAYNAAIRTFLNQVEGR